MECKLSGVMVSSTSIYSFRLTIWIANVAIYTSFNPAFTCFILTMWT
ncbi:hypothetical protein QPD51_02815 [Clostridioides difficile]|nr:hypothetical protein [Clostridioides difficile]MDK3140442.1 hypothetical protein [Clostridioides difficile]